jgi:adenylosuccinate lyase
MELQALSPLDGRYEALVAELRPIFSEAGLITRRIAVEWRYLHRLIGFLNPPNVPMPPESLGCLYDDDSRDSHTGLVKRSKEIERTTEHDVKALELAIGERLRSLNYGACVPFVHFGLTSQDVNNVAMWLQLRDGRSILLAALHDISCQLHDNFFLPFAELVMLARTHGQPATPTTLGKEFMVFVERLSRACSGVESVPVRTKFGGATGGFNAHAVAYPSVDWPKFADAFLMSEFSMERQQFTTQIDHYDGVAELFQAIARCNTILIDLCRDIWHYISLGYFRQRRQAGSVGSSTMPHKVNPIQFENAQGNLELANAMFGLFAAKLPVSLLQRDLTDSTLTRNFGVAFGHCLVAYKNINKGLKTLCVDQERIAEDLAAHPEVVMEGLQTVLRSLGVSNAYDMAKKASEQLELKREEGLVAAFCASKGIAELQPTSYKPILAKVDFFGCE